MKQRDDPAPNRAIFIVRVWRNSPHSRWVVEVQNVRTGAVTHLPDLEAVPGYILDQIAALPPETPAHAET